MSKMNARLSVVRPAILAVALLLTVIATISPAAAACVNGTTRTIIANILCCGSYPPAKVTKQNQKCIGGVWVNQGGTYCASHSTCAF